jgi:Cof subfamily protein (haloacid dehalogenase superfamily)
MKKIVFFDIDGTLLDHEKQIPKRTKEAIYKLKENGIYVAIATGRAPFMFRSLIEELEIETFVSFNGQYVVFENDVIYKNPLPTSEIEALLEEAKTKEHPVVFMNHQEMKGNIEHHTYIEESMGSLKFDHPPYDPTYYQENEIYQALLFCREEEEEQYLQKYPNFKFVRWHPYSTDILPSGGSKAEGIKKLISRLNFSMKDVYAFGDGLNDIEMLQSVGTGVAMGNAHPIVKKAANVVTRDVADDGIYEGLKMLNLID